MKILLLICLVFIFAVRGLQAAEEDAIRFSVSSVRYIGNMRTRERSAAVTLQVNGIDAARVRAMRIVLTNAEDQNGIALKQDAGSAFSGISVGRTEGDNSFVTSRRAEASFGVRSISKSATQLRNVEGIVELFIPDRDPAATLIVDGIASRLGTPLVAPGTDEPAVTLTVFNQALCERYRSNPIKGEGPQEYDGGPMFGHAYDSMAAASPGMAKELARMREIHEADLAVGVEDSGNRMVNVEFQTSTGDNLLYNHNGNYHSSGLAGKRLDIYDLRTPIARDARMICWVTTAKSIVRVPLNLTEIALPQK